jgi:hypothetical protein
LFVVNRKNWNHEVNTKVHEEELEPRSHTEFHEEKPGITEGTEEPRRKSWKQKNWNHEELEPRKSWNHEVPPSFTKEELESPKTLKQGHEAELHEEKPGITEGTEEPRRKNWNHEELEPRKSWNHEVPPSFTKKNLESQTLKQGASGDPRRKTWNHRSYRKTRRKSWKQKNWNHEKLEPRSSTSFTKKDVESPKLPKNTKKTWKQKNWNHEELEPRKSWNHEVPPVSRRKTWNHRP